MPRPGRAELRVATAGVGRRGSLRRAGVRAARVDLSVTGRRPSPPGADPPAAQCRRANVREDAMRVPAASSGRVLTAGAPAAIMLALLGVLSAGCGGGAAPATVPSLSGASGSHAAGGGRAADLHAAAQCIRQHGVPGYADPVLTSSGAVYSDRRSIQDASQSVLDTVQAACGSVLARAQLNPMHEPPAPPQLVQAGVRAARCMRAHGLPNDADPTAEHPVHAGPRFRAQRPRGPGRREAEPRLPAGHPRLPAAGRRGDPRVDPVQPGPGRLTCGPDGSPRPGRSWPAGRRRG